MIFSVSAVFFTSVAGVSGAELGSVRGMADVSTSSLNDLSGWLSDRSGTRKVYAFAGYAFAGYAFAGYAFAGYGCSTLAKVMLLVTSSLRSLSLFRVMERLGKGFRGPPRDAWVSAVAHQQTRRFALGVHKALLGKAGAVLGTLAAYGLFAARPCNRVQHHADRAAVCAVQHRLLRLGRWQAWWGTASAATPS